MDQKRPRLGRGLTSLLSRPVEVAGESSPKSLPIMLEVGASVGTPTKTQRLESPSIPTTTFQMVTVSAVRPNPFQPRRQMNADTLAELSASIRASGIIQPIVVRSSSDGFELIAGERRWRAAQLAEVAEIPAIVREVDSASQAQMALIENIHRENLNPIDRANSYRTLMAELHLTQIELAERLGEDRSVIANYLRLLQLAEPVRQSVRDGRLSVGHAKLLAGVDDATEQQRLAELVVSNELSVRNLERMMKTPSRAVRNTATPSAHLKDLENRLSTQLGMRISLRTAGRKGAGRITIHYGDLDQFDHLIHKLGLESSEL